jgi:cytochrome c oxidase subunit 2
MKVDLYERIWMYAVVVMLALFFTSTAVAAVKGGIHPPSHVETIDPTKVFADARFQPPGVSVDRSGRVHARVIGLTFAWMPATMTVPAATPVSFHVTSTDVLHGFQIVGTNGQTMVVPGYISQFTTEFDPGEYLIACNEYCGVGHHTMASRLRVVPRAAWTAPAVSLPPAPPAPATSTTGGAHDAH